MFVCCCFFVCLCFVRLLFLVRQVCVTFLATVVWNPWKEKAKAMGDFGDDEVRKAPFVIGL